MLGLLFGMTAPAVAQSRNVNTAMPKESAVTAKVPDGMKFDVSAPVTPKISRQVRDLPLDSGKPAPQREINRPRGVPETQGHGYKDSGSIGSQQPERWSYT